MKHVTKRLLGVLLAAVLVASGAVSAFAAETVTATALPGATAAAGTAATATAAGDYSVTFQNGNKMIYKQNGKTYSYNVKNTDVTLTTNADGDLLVCYYNAEGTYRAMSLGSQKSLTISGALSALTIDESLSNKITLNLYASINKLSVEGANNVNIYGKVSTSNVYSAANITVKSGGVISVQTLRNSKATVSVDKGGTIGKSNVVSDPAPKPDPEPTKRSYRLNIGTIYTQYGTTLAELRNELSNNVDAYDAKTYNDIEGTVTWTKTGSTKLYSDGTYSFTFRPKSSAYASMTGKISVCVDEVHGNVYLNYNQDHISITGNQTLNELKYQLDSDVYAIDDRGNYVSGTLTWNDPPYTIAEHDQYYSFTFTPSSSKYSKLSGSIRAMSTLPQVNNPVMEDTDLTD